MNATHTVRWITLLLVPVLLMLQAQLWFSDGGAREVSRLQRQVDAQELENASLAARNAALMAEVRDLKGGTAAAEERARSDLGMILSGETFFQIVPAQPAD